MRQPAPAGRLGSREARLAGAPTRKVEISGGPANPRGGEWPGRGSAVVAGVEDVSRTVDLGVVADRELVAAPFSVGAAGADPAGVDRDGVSHGALVQQQAQPPVLQLSWRCRRGSSRSRPRDRRSIVRGAYRRG